MNEYKLKTDRVIVETPNGYMTWGSCFTLYPCGCIGVALEPAPVMQSGAPELVVRTH